MKETELAARDFHIFQGLIKGLSDAVKKPGNSILGVESRQAQRFDALMERLGELADEKPAA